MRITRLVPVVAVLLLGACASTNTALNSERIAAKFGSFGIDVISQANGIRRSSLYSIHGTEKITRTYAIVLFAPDLPDTVTTLHARVMHGASIGATYKAAGWDIEKTTTDVGTLELESDPYAITSMMQLDGQPQLALHIYKFALRKGAQVIDYATIIEAHHPAFMSPDELASLFQVDPAYRNRDTAELKSLLLEHPVATDTAH